MTSKPVKRVTVTGASGQIAYSALFRIAAGDLFGHDQPICLHLLDLPDAQGSLQGVVMELEDCAFPLLREVRMGSDPYQVFEGVDVALLIGAKPRGPGMERKDLLAENGKIFIEQGKALNQSAAQNAIVFVVGNPCNTNTLIALRNAPKLKPSHFFAMTRLDQNRAVGFLARKSGQPIAAVQHMAIWGNHSATQVPDFMNAKIAGKPALEVIKDMNWLRQEFVPAVQKRGAAVIAARGKSSAASAANAMVDGVRSLLQPTPEGQWFSCGVYSKGNSYGIDQDLVFSFPCRSKGDGHIEIVKGLPWDDFLHEKIRMTEKELIEERTLISRG